MEEFRILDAIFGGALTEKIEKVEKVYKEGVRRSNTIGVVLSYED